MRSSLSLQDQFTYDLLSSDLSHSLKGTSFFYYNEVLSPSSGAQGQYPILMCEYTFRSKKDIEDYLTLLSLTPDYFTSLYQLERERADRGLLMPDYSLRKTIKQCQTLITADALSGHHHFLQTTFEERIQNAVKEKIITGEEASSYQKKNESVLLHSVLPAYQTLSNNLSTLLTKGKSSGGLCHVENGKQYYKWLLQETTGSSEDPEDIYQELTNDYIKNIGELREKAQLFSDSCTLTEEEFSYFPQNDPDLILDDLTKRMANDFPSIASIRTNTMTHVDVKHVSSSLEDYTAPAYYLTPPIDDVLNNVIYINDKNVPDGLQLYTTLAHEGYPGHLYQTVYYQLYSQSKNTPSIRSLLNYGGYAEGWALYTELYSYEYAGDLLVEKTGKDSYRDLYSLFACERKTQLALLSLLDIGIHYYGFSYEKAEKILQSYGITDTAKIREIYEYIEEEPANYPKYYWGYMEFMHLKESATHYWANQYSDYRFHQFVLQSGPSDFTNLSKNLAKTAGK